MAFEGPVGRTVAADAWAHGWAISRGTPPPVRNAGYLQIQVGRPEQTTRYVLPELDRRLLRRLLSGEAGPGTWLKVCAASAKVSALLTSDWQVHEPEFLMSARLVGSAAALAAGYRVHIESAASLVVAKIVAADGELAASGQVAIDGGFATFDQIVTTEAHRRKGLGRSVMAALAQAALDLGARQGVLVATEAGAGLYGTLGWSLVSPVTAASRVADVASLHNPRPASDSEVTA